MQSVRLPLVGTPPPQNPPVSAEYPQKKGNLLIWYMWEKGMKYIIDTRVVNTDTTSHVQKTPEKSLLAAE